jgi:hypothetical protein
MSKRKIAASLGVSATAAGECIRRARRAGLIWPLPDGLSDEALERQLFPSPAVAAKDQRPQPDWAAIHRELRRPGVTLQLLWEEHRAVHPDGYGISRYCELYRAWIAEHRGFATGVEVKEYEKVPAPADCPFWSRRRMTA